MEELVLTDPIVEPEKVTSKYKVTSLLMDHDSTVNSPFPGVITGLMSIQLKDNLGNGFTHQYIGQEAIDFIKYINTANFTTKSLHKRILERLSNDGILPGTVTGTPDPPADDTEF